MYRKKASLDGSVRTNSSPAIIARTQSFDVDRSQPLCYASVSASTKVKGWAQVRQHDIIPLYGTLGDNMLIVNNRQHLPRTSLTLDKHTANIYLYHVVQKIIEDPEKEWGIDRPLLIDMCLTQGDLLEKLVFELASKEDRTTFLRCDSTHCSLLVAAVFNSNYVTLFKEGLTGLESVDAVKNYLFKQIPYYPCLVHVVNGLGENGLCVLCLRLVSPWLATHGNIPLAKSVQACVNQQDIQHNKFSCIGSHTVTRDLLNVSIDLYKRMYSNGRASIEKVEMIRKYLKLP